MNEQINLDCFNQTWDKKLTRFAKRGRSQLMHDSAEQSQIEERTPLESGERAEHAEIGQMEDMQIDTALVE